ncbi:MAG: response regulator [Cytophagaceae bacterium]|jgi:CheY-like chemotaxis protein
MKPAESKMIMLIDDSDIDNYINRKIIRDHEITDNILILTTAFEALKYFKSNPGEEKIPNLILLDINLPALSGYDFLKKFGELAPFVRNKSKIVIVTSSDRQEDMDRMKSHPLVKDYFVKPLTSEALNTIKAILE